LGPWVADYPRKLDALAAENCRETAAGWETKKDSRAASKEMASKMKVKGVEEDKSNEAGKASRRRLDRLHIPAAHQIREQSMM
jgi:hypothetical protein